MVQYSHRLGELSTGQFQAALDRFDLGQFIRAEPISAGNFGQNVYLTSATGEYILRGAPFSALPVPAGALFCRPPARPYPRARPLALPA